MFQNEYRMDLKRYQRWTCPIATKAKGFWIWLAVTVLALPTALWLYAVDARQGFKNTALLLTVAGVYRAFLFRPMYANKQFRLLSRQLGKQSWMTRVVIDDTLRLYVDGELNNEVEWSQVKALAEAKSYFDLEVGDDYLRLDKACFTEGDAESFRAFMTERHPEIPHQEEKAEFNR